MSAKRFLEIATSAIWKARATRKPCPSDRAFAFPYPLLAGSALVVEADDVLGRPRHVGDDEVDARVQFAGCHSIFATTRRGFVQLPA
jgi:hypothetical protein